MLDASRGLFALFVLLAMFALASGGTLIPHRLGLFFSAAKKVEEQDQNEEFLTGGEILISYLRLGSISSSDIDSPGWFCHSPMYD